jgi:hypothetical protein
VYGAWATPSYAPQSLTSTLFCVLPGTLTPACSLFAHFPPPQQIYCLRKRYLFLHDQDFGGDRLANRV